MTQNLNFSHKLHVDTKRVFNFYEELKGELSYNKFEVEGLLFVEYNCPLENESVKIWSKSDYIVYVLSGKKTWRTSTGSWTIIKGEALYIKKGAAILDQFLDREFCMLGFFISDDIIKDWVKDNSSQLAMPLEDYNIPQDIVKLHNIPNLDTFYLSMLSYFRYSDLPLAQILELKAKELLLHIVGSGEHQDLAAYFKSIEEQSNSNLQQIMEHNYSYNLSLTEFADLCNRSLSSFKRDFKKVFKISPGKWLLERRLKKASNLLLSEDTSVSIIAFDTGFENATHFSRVFKNKFEKSPLQYRKAHL